MAVLIVVNFVEGVFKVLVRLVDEAVEFGFVLHCAEIERLRRTKDGSVLGEVAVAGIVEAVCGGWLILLV